MKDFYLLSIRSFENKILLSGVDKEGSFVKKEEVFNPYFYALLTENDKNFLKKIKDYDEVTECRLIKKELFGEEKEFLKIWVNGHKILKKTAKKIKEELSFVIEIYEHRVKGYKKFLFDKKITPLVSNNELLENPRIVCFDIETYNPRGFSSPDEHPIIMISIVSNTGYKKVLTYKKIDRGFVKVLGSEKEMIKEFNKVINELNPHFLVGYNSDRFDFKYLVKRAKIYGMTLVFEPFSEKVERIRKGRGYPYRIFGPVHIDLYPFISTALSTYLKTEDYKLDSVCEALLGDKKNECELDNMYNDWDEEKDLEKYAEYNLQDSVLTLKLAEEVFPLLFELTRIVGIPVFNASRIGISSLVENYLMKNAHNFNQIIPNNPSGSEVGKRFAKTYKGGFVREPVPGFYENIVVYDFRSLYPSIIVAHNICPTTLTDKNENIYESPVVNGESFKFLKTPQGFIPFLIEKLINSRTKIKKKLKKMDENNKEYNILDSRQSAMKLLANAIYGYLGFPHSRWYDLGCAASITGWGRKYIHEVMNTAEKEGFSVLYGDTDSIIFSLPSDNKSKAESFIKGVNKKLPEGVTLEFEGFFQTGVFVSKKREKGGAKKKYALYNKESGIEVKGFEAVRRDWSMLAKKLQKKVLYNILVKKDFDNALRVVNNTIQKVKNNDYDLKDFVITTQLRKKIENYKSQGPHVRAAIRAKRKGVNILSGMNIKYVVVSGHGSISDRAYIPEQAEKKGLVPDADYYINNQLIPSVKRILTAAGVNEKRIGLTRQKTLEGF